MPSVSILVVPGRGAAERSAASGIVGLRSWRVGLRDQSTAGRFPIQGKPGGWLRPPSDEAQPETLRPALEPAPHRGGIRGTLAVRAVGNTLLQHTLRLAG